jgi:hypothetical protein
MYRENTQHFDDSKCVTVEVDVKTLDGVMKLRPDFARIDLLKLDVQGAEIDVLKGATDTLQKTHMVLAECSIIEYNHNAPLVSDVIEFMRSRGFRVLDVCDLNYCDGFLLQIDLLFVKDTSCCIPRVDRHGVRLALQGGYVGVQNKRLDLAQNNNIKN